MSRTPPTALRRIGRRAAMLLLAGVLAGAAAVLLQGLARRDADDPVPVEPVRRRDIEVVIEATGTVEPVNLIEVKSKASGQIIRMPVEVGSVVRAGDLLAQIDTVDVQNQYDQALAALTAAQATADIAAAQKRRADELFDQQVITAGEHETATRDDANAQAQLVRARADLASARLRLADATVRAPAPGTILEQLVTVGQMISSATSSVSGGTTLLRMADLGRIRMRVLVSESDIGRVRPGGTATVTVESFPQRSFQGRVEKIEPQAVIQQSVTLFPVLVSISNQDRALLPGMNGQVSMPVEEREDVLAVPLDAVRTARELPAVAAALGMSPEWASAQVERQSAAAGRHGKRSQVVFVETERGLEPRLVRLGLSNFDYAQVLDGLEEKDRVALLSVPELQAKRKHYQDRVRRRYGSAVPGGAGGSAGAP